MIQNHLIQLARPRAGLAAQLLLPTVIGILPAIAEAVLIVQRSLHTFEVKVGTDTEALDETRVVPGTTERASPVLERSAKDARVAGQSMASPPHFTAPTTTVLHT